MRWTRGRTPPRPAAAARERAENTRSLFYVDTLEYLRRGGRVGAAAALLGSALSVKPILEVTEGRIGPLERVRTSAKALARLEELAVEAAGDGPVDIAVAHLASPERATQLAEHLPSGSPTGSRAARCGTARSAPSSAPTSAPAWSPWPCRGAAESPHGS